MKLKTYDWSKIKNLVVRAGHCHARFEMNGKQIWRSLHVEADPEGKNAEIVKETLRVLRLKLAQDTFSILQLTRTRSETSSFADLFKAYRETCAGRDIASATVDRNVLDMKLILRAVHGEHFAAEAARVSLCTVDLLIDFRAARMAAVKAKALAEKWTEEMYQKKLASTRRTTKSTIQHARSLFAQEVMQEKPYRELTLPAADVLAKFMKFRSGGGTTRDFEMPDASVLEKLRDGATLFKGTRPDLWLALVLTANLGMRRGSARVARWDWFKQRDDGATIAHIRAAKGNRSSVGVTPTTWAAMQLQQGTPARDYVLPGADDAARDAVLDELLVWLRGIGFDEARCPVHELRGLFVNKMGREHSFDDAQGATGHSTQKVMMDSYVERGTDKAVDVV